MNHSADKDVMLLIDKPQSNFAIQVIADYAPAKEGDEGGLLIIKMKRIRLNFLNLMLLMVHKAIKSGWQFVRKINGTFTQRQIHFLIMRITTH